jgi:ParB family chromosome partitioning protein
MDDQKHLSIHVLREPKVRLRDVDRESVEYLELRDSIREHGILQPLLVRPIGDDFEIIEGLHRFTAAEEAGLKEAPCLIRECSDDEALVLMLQANAISPETKLAEYAQQLKRLMTRNPDMTIRELSCLIRKSPSWIGKCLNLIRLRKDLQVVVDRGEIPIENAYMLAKIPCSMQRDYVDRAKVMPHKEFRILAAACVKQYMEAVKQGKMDAFYSDEFQAVAHLRQLKEIEEELRKKGAGALVCTGEGCQTVLDGFYAGLRWACHLDRTSVKEQEQVIRARRERQVLDVQVEE